MKMHILDTNVLIHDPACLFRFEEHDIFIPMKVVEELDKHKKGEAEEARSARQASRFLDDLIKDLDLSTIQNGIPISRAGSGNLGKNSTGCLFLQTRELELEPLPEGTTAGLNDNIILMVALALKKKFPERDIILVSIDTNMRIKAAALGLRAENYSSDEAIEDINLLSSGVAELPLDFWETHGKDMKAWKEKESGRSFFQVKGPLVSGWYPNQFLYLPDDTKFEAIVRQREKDTATIEVVKDFRTQKNAVWGIRARNREQNFALNALMDPEIDLVLLLGTAGAGKTLTALVAGLAQTLDSKRFREIVMTRETIPLGKDIGFLPGTEEEKMAPWMGALLDNLELLNGDSGKYGGDVNGWEKAATKDLLAKRIAVRSLNFMRGRTFLNRYIILDEAQNLNTKQIKTLISRAGPGTKMVCLGNLGQIDTPFLIPTTTGLTNVVERSRNWQHSAHITLCKGERSRLADFANENL